MRDGNTDFITYFSELDELLGAQLFVVYPLIEFFTPETASDFLSSFIGHGIGSTTILLRTVDDTDLLQNSASQLARLLYEQGIIGFLFFLNIHFSIVKKSTLSINSSKLEKSLYFIFSTLILITFWFIEDLNIFYFWV